MSAIPSTNAAQEIWQAAGDLSANRGATLRTQERIDTAGPTIPKIRGGRLALAKDGLPRPGSLLEVVI